MNWKNLLLIPFFMMGSAVFGDSYVIPKAAQPVRVDGVIEEAEWRRSLLLSGAGMPIDQRSCQVRFAWNEEYLYVSFRSALPPGNRLVLNGKAVIFDDGVELWFVPPKSLRTAEQYKFGEFQILVNPKGKVYSRHHNPGYGLSAREWNANARIGNSIRDGFWEIEIAIPAASFGMRKLSESDWKILAVRNYRTVPDRQASFMQVSSFSDSSQYADFALGKDTIVQNDYSQSGIPSVLRGGGTPGSWELRAGINGEAMTRTASGRECLFDLSSSFVPAGGEGKIVLKKDGKVVFRRKLKYDRKADRIWFNPEAYRVLRHDFSQGPDKASIFPEKCKVVPSGKIRSVSGRLEGSFAGEFTTAQESLRFQGFRVPVPGCISLWMRSDVDQKKPFRRYFATKFVPSGYFGYQDMGTYTMLFFHNFAPKQINIVSSRRPPKGKWIHLAVNLTPKKVEFFTNGVKVAERSFDFVLDGTKLGDFAIGGGAGGFSVDEVDVFARVLTPEEICVMAQGEKRISGDISFYPSINALVADLSCVPGKLTSDTLLLTLTDGGGKEVFYGSISTKQAWKIQQNGERMIAIHSSIPLKRRLPEGNYILRILEPGDDSPLLEKNIQIKNYPWLNNDIAKRERIIPPFTPLKTDGDRISCILRDYFFAGSGLPRQIKAAGKDILAAPIRFFSENNGIATALKPGKFTVAGKSDTAVSFLGSAGGGFDVKVKGRMEFDGMIRLDMDIAKSEGIVSDRFFIDIPVKKEFAVLFHAVGEGLRSNPAGFLPSGTDVIWKSSSIPQVHFDNFIPYIWVGDDERGICYAADWEKDWVHGKKHDAVELFRHGNGDVSIRLNLLNSPAMNRTYRISIALMASPVKPQPEGWRGWSDGFLCEGTKVARGLYSPPYWGGFTCWTARYPTFGEFGYIRKLRETLDTGIVDNAYKNAWIERVQKVRPHDYPGRVKNHTDTAFHLAAQLHKYRDRAVLYPYTCNAEAANQLDEYPVMRGEWGNGARVSIPSYADYAIYYLREMLKAGFNGVYDDNTFFVANYNWATGNAYIDEKGNIRPSLGLWKNREYIQRQAFLMHELGITPWITVHHTNANILPVLSMATNTMGMEWKFGLSDFQERFSADYIRAVCQGRQGGVFPTVIDGIVGGNRDKRIWATRTMLATLLTHEVRPTFPQNSDAALCRKIHQLMFDFGIHRKECVSSPYWAADCPVKTDDPEVLFTSYRLGKKILAFCGSFKSTDTVVRLGADAKILSARDLETGKNCVIADGKVSIPLKKHDFALVELVVEK